MAYTRGEIYIWSDGTHLHLWSESGMDDWPNMERYQGNPAASGVQIPDTVADEFAVMRFAELLASGDAAAAIERTLQNGSGNFGCASLERLASQLRQLASDPELILRAGKR